MSCPIRRRKCIVDPAPEPRAFEDERAVDLHEVGARGERAEDVLRRADATTGNEGSAPGEPGPDLVCALTEGRARDAAVAPGLDAGSVPGRHETPVDCG